MLAESKSRTFLRSSGLVRTLWIRAAEVRGHSSPAVGGLPHGTLDNLVVLRTCESSGRLALGQSMDHVRPKGEQSLFELGTRVAEVLGCSPADAVVEDLPHLWPLPPCHPPYCLLLTAVPVLSSSALLSTSSRKLCYSAGTHPPPDLLGLPTSACVERDARRWCPLDSGDPATSNFSDQGGPKTLFKAAEFGPDLLHDNSSMLKASIPEAAAISRFDLVFSLAKGRR